MFEYKNIFVLNKKDKSAIVYEDADGHIIRLTCEVFDNEEEFRRWKDWSDKDYHEAEKERHLQSDNTLSLKGLSDEAAAVGSAEGQFIKRQRECEHEELRHLLMTGFDTCLTATQRRRLWLYCVDGLTVEQIANAEKVAHQNVSKAIALAKKKLKIFLRNRVQKPRFRRDR